MLGIWVPSAGAPVPVTSALGRMKSILANSSITIGIVVLVYALTWALGLLPVDFVLPSDGQALSRYWRAVPTASQGVGYLPYALAIVGLAILAMGLALRRRLRNTAA